MNQSKILKMCKHFFIFKYQIFCIASKYQASIWGCIWQTPVKSVQVSSTVFACSKLIFKSLSKYLLWILAIKSLRLFFGQKIYLNQSFRQLRRLGVKSDDDSISNRQLIIRLGDYCQLEKDSVFSVSVLIYFPDTVAAL